MGFWSAVGDVLTFGQVSRNQASSDVSFTFIFKKENYEFFWNFSMIWILEKACWPGRTEGQTHTKWTWCRNVGNLELIFELTGVCYLFRPDHEVPCKSKRMRNDFTRQISQLRNQHSSDLERIAEQDLGKKAMKREMDQIKAKHNEQMKQQKQKLENELSRKVNSHFWNSSEHLN